MPVVFAALTAFLAGCGSEPPEQWPPAKVYSVRGVVASLPQPDRPRDWIGVRHEAIPDFVGIIGEIDPMASMTMDFAVADGVDATVLDIGTKIAFELEVDWSADVRARVIALEILPAETELAFGAGQ